MMIFQIIGAFVAIIAFAVYVEAPKKYLVFCGIIGAIGWLVYLVAIQRFEILSSNFLSALMIAFISHLFARAFKAPVTVFLISGIMTLVPGAGMYRAVSQILLGNRSLAMEYLQQTIQIAGVIALAIFIMDAVFRVLRIQKWKEQIPKPKK
jgi:uncharacterized membrane protein YjjB (DUF3815 family)